MPLIIAETAEQAREYARRLLEVADNPSEVATDTTQNNAAVAFEVSAELAEKAGFSIDDVPDPQPSVPTPADPVEVEPPARNGSTAEWREFLSTRTPPIPYPAEAKRDELVAIWDAHK